MSICAKKIEKRDVNIQNEPIPTLAVSHMPGKRPDAAHLAKRRGHRQQLVLREVRGQSINIDIRRSALGIRADTSIAARVRLQLSLLTGNCVL
jgi:hypothetical protein